MSKWPRYLVRTLLYLDYLPRYGRVYAIENYNPNLDPRDQTLTTEWLWQWRGRWGFSVCDRYFSKTLWRYISEQVGEDDDPPVNRPE